MTAQPPSTDPHPASPAPSESPPDPLLAVPPGADPFQALGEEVTRILQAGYAAARQMQQQAEDDLAQLRQEALGQADQIRTDAQRDAEARLQRAEAEVRALRVQAEALRGDLAEGRRRLNEDLAGLRSTRQEAINQLAELRSNLTALLNGHPSRRPED